MRNQKDLQGEANKIIDRLGLIGILEKHGETRLVGSVALGLVVKLDLDLHVLVIDSTLMDTVSAVTTELLDIDEIFEVRISDYRPRGVKIGIDECAGPSGNWTIDIWLSTDRSTTAFDNTEQVKASLTPSLRKTILEIKQYFYERGELRDGISNVIYGAVLRGISNVEEFQASPEYKEHIRY